MRILLDTHIFLWAITDDERLSSAHRELFAEAGNELILSVASMWEASIKVSLGKLQLPSPGAGYLSKQMERNRVSMLAIQVAHLIELENLPPIHRDPFDRLIAAQARAEGIPIMSADPQLRMYDVPIL